MDSNAILSAHIYRFHLNPDPEVGIELSDEGTVRAKIQSFYSDLPIDQEIEKVKTLVQGWNTERTWYEIAGPCKDCHEQIGRPVITLGSMDVEYVCGGCSQVAAQ